MANDQKKPPRFVDRSASVAGQDYARLLQELKENYRKAQIKAAVCVNSDLLEYYWYMGRQISSLQAKSKWGSAFFDTLSLDLKAEFPTQAGFSVTNIKYIVRWYNFYNQSDIIRQPPVDELQMPTDFGLIPWGHSNARRPNLHPGHGILSHPAEMLCGY